MWCSPGVHSRTAQAPCNVLGASPKPSFSRPLPPKPWPKARCHEPQAQRSTRAGPDISTELNSSSVSDSFLYTADDTNGVKDLSTDNETAGSSAVLSWPELDQVMTGLRSSLESIQVSRQQYVELLTERDADLAAVLAQLQQTEARCTSLDRQLRATQGQLAAVRSTAARAQGDTQRASVQAAELQAKLAAHAPLPPSPAQPQPQPAQVAQAPAVKSVQAPEPPRVQPPPAPPPIDITLTFKCPAHWPECFLHYEAEGRGWTSMPGVRMERAGDAYTLRIPGKVAEFVFNNGGQEWDSIPGNYKIWSPGSYRVEGGKVQRT
mmetsp:Transcript_18852/g.32211  ORF Transcript_18852/g.32211 Transcript_18852/m.32211 type:complete len:321 (+) Transcript_18852:114-1076(+)